MCLGMELPVVNFVASETGILKFLLYIVTAWVLLAGISCQHVSSADTNHNSTDVFADFHDSSIRDTNHVQSLLQKAVSDNLPKFDVLNNSTPGVLRSAGVTMKPTHVPAMGMSQFIWNIHRNSQTDNIGKPQIIPHQGLPIPFSMLEEREHVNSNRTKADTFSFPSGQNQGNAGIYIPMHKLLRRRRQTRQQPRTIGHRGRSRQGVLTMLNPIVTGNQTRDVRQLMFFSRQPNSPLYNITTANATSGQIRNSSNLTEQRLKNNRNVQGKPALQHLGDLNLVDLTFPLMASNNQVKVAQNDSSTSRTNQSGRHGSPTSRTNQSTRQGSSSIRTNQSGRQGSFTIRTNQSGRQSSPTSRTNPSRRPGSNNNSLIHSARRNTNGTNIRQITRPRPMQLGREQSSRTSRTQVTRVPPRRSGRIINLRLQSRRQTPSPISGRSSGTRPAINRQVTRRPATRLTFVQPVSGQRISSLPRRSSSSGRSRSRPATRSRTNISSRSPTRRRQTIPTRSVGRRVSSIPRRTITRGTRRSRPSRRRTPPDPFTQRFSAGFQRGSTLLHQPPMDITSFDGARRDVTLNRAPPAPGFMNSIALQNNIPFPGVGPGLFGGGPGMFIGDGFI